MTLRRKMVCQIGAMIVGLLLISAASLWGINALHQDFGSAVAGFEELRQVYEASSHVAIALTLLNLEKPDDRRAMREIQTAAGLIALYAPAEPPAEPARRRQLHLAVRDGLTEAQGELWEVIASRASGNRPAVILQLNRVLKDVSDLATEIRQSIQAKQRAADSKRKATMLIMGVLSTMVITGSVILGLLEHRGVMRPLLRLSAGVRRLARGHLDQRIEPTGHVEFAALAEDFNRMAGELDELYRDLERKVATKSKELVRSERLASVGFLAAGIAHEINNPIGIIAGHAELCLQNLRRKPGPAALEEARKALEIVTEEAFRCKQIVEKLLTLARPGEESRQPVSLGDVAREVVAMVGGLKNYRDRRLVLDVQQGEELEVMANEGEMKQVLLNLVLNGLEAVEAGGEVKVRVEAVEQQVGLCVEDNGRGMSPEVLEHVFEPFFTAKRGAGRPGTGLGLSITHAIVENHQGQITAQSEGIGRGSRFVVRFPALKGVRP